MSIEATRDSICQKLDLAFTGFLGITSAAYGAVSSSINSIKTFISGMQFSALSELQQVASQVDSALDDVIPDFTDEFDEILRMINSCAFLRTDKTLGNPLTVIRTLEGSIRSNAQAVFDELASSLDEFNVSKLMDALFVRYENEFNFNKIIPDMYTIIGCIDSLCPNTDITSKIASFEEYVNKLYLLTNGKFDKITFYDELKLSAQQALKIDIGLASYESMRDRVSESISNGVDYAKSLG